VKCLVPSLILLFALYRSGLEATTLTSRAQGIELLANDGSLRARIIFDRDRVLLDFPIQHRGYLFEVGSYASLNHSQRSYRAHSYPNLLASLHN
jgi:hypothetical protein